ncbi:hypothetical protein BDN70DRAFT_931440 [Pholiota conissans]|uniref:F-box domain-containing protein n=1 Tax=Pholiota conissans TaxID=109636 RepID=A0A9P5Z4A4_9AGAR|nr:hypothetical protein BDN70DRAFT_931440 [Pholiota conissans]
MALPQLPQDIIDVIIQTIAETSPFDAKQLGDLSLVSRAFVEQSQRYLFRTISLRRLDYKPSSFRLSDNADIKGSAFQDLFRTSPHVFRYIRTWLLQIPWAITGPEAAAIINACTRLQVLELASPSIGEVIDWHTIDPALRSALISQIHSTLLDKLTLSRVKHIPQFLLATFGLFTRLQLEYSFSSHFHSSQPNDAATTVPSKLTTLSIKESTPLLRFFLVHHPSMFSQILEVDVDFGRFNGVEDSSLMGDLLHKVCKIKEFHAILLTNGKFYSVYHH